MLIAAETTLCRKLSESISFTLLITQYSHIIPNSLMVGKAMSDEILTLKEVAEYLKLAEKTAYRLALEGKLPGFKVGGSWRFKREDILKWIEEQKNK
ncbi:excisionase family DNA binding domain [Cycloclasticus pugetii]|uniref:Excisionase family DNA binding domain n=2 Tax=Piscirickettsiaceae TaxID=135616 RepID=A0AB33Z249_9GAMM|nr:excisionase family DNA binding domain [Cycloclasticus pugetii]